MTELTKWAKLDTWRMMKEIEAAHGSAIFTEDALLDPHLMVRQLNSALGTSLGAQDVLDICGRGALDINTILGGSPSGTLTELAFMDFVNGVYRLNGSTVSLTDILTFDDADWGIVDPANIIPGSGFLATTGGGSFPRFADAVQTALLAEGFTLVAEFDYLVSTEGFSNDGMTFDLELWSLDFSGNYSAIANGDHFVIGDGTHSTITNFADGKTSGRHKFATTILASGIDASEDGLEVIHMSPDPPTTLHYIGFDVSRVIADNNYLRTVTVYSPQMAADLPSLSTE